MSSRWAMLGSQIGSGLGNALNQITGPSLQIKALERAHVPVDENLKRMLALSSVLGGSGGSGGGLYNMYLMQSLMNGGGGGLSGIFGGTPDVGDLSSAPTPLSSVPAGHGGVGRLIQNDLAAPQNPTDPIEVQDLATGQFGTMPYNEFDVTKYRRVK